MIELQRAIFERSLDRPPPFDFKRLIRLGARQAKAFALVARHELRADDDVDFLKKATSALKAGNASCRSASSASAKPVAKVVPVCNAVADHAWSPRAARESSRAARERETELTAPAVEKHDRLSRGEDRSRGSGSKRTPRRSRATWPLH